MPLIFILFFFRLKLTFSCMMELNKYPLDDQTCTMEIASCKWYILWYTDPWPNYLWFLTKYLDPCLYYTFDLTHQIPQGICLFTTFQQIQSRTSNVLSQEDLQICLNNILLKQLLRYWIIYWFCRFLLSEMKWYCSLDTIFYRHIY